MASAFQGGGLSRSRRALLALACVATAGLVWLPSVHLLYQPDAAELDLAGPLPRRVRALARRQLGLWREPARRARELERMRRANAEWDFMGRTYLVLALANMALREPERESRHLGVIDAIIDETLRLERERSMFFFLMDYARSGRFVMQPPRSLFVDGEIALMLGARRLVQERAAYRGPMRRRVAEIARRMGRGPVACAESYPDECWIFCNTVALAALRVSDVIDRTDHRALFRRWVRTARRRLVDRTTGMLVSSFTLDGQVKDGPEGSSIWMAAHMLQVVDRELAREQYRLARAALTRSVLGFAYATEWPAGAGGRLDVDSGPVVPVLGASPSSSGLALVAARAFGDRELYAGLLATLELAGFPIREGQTLRYAASNQVGDAVMLYAAALGPLWRRVGPPGGGR